MGKEGTIRDLVTRGLSLLAPYERDAGAETIAVSRCQSQGLSSLQPDTPLKDWYVHTAFA